MRGLVARLLGVGGFVTLVASGCAFDWDYYDPRLGVATDAGVDGGSAVVSDGGADAGSDAGLDAGADGGGSGGADGGAVDAGSDAGVGDAGVPSCGGTDLLGESFDAGGVLREWEYSASANGQVYIVGAELVCRVTSAVAANQFAVAFSRRRTSLIGHDISVEVTQVPASQLGVQTYLAVTGQGGDALSIYQQEGQLGCEKHVGGSVSQLSSVVWSPVNHRFWRLRESGGTTFWETSADGQSWVVQVQQATSSLFPLGTVEAEFGLYVPSGTSSPGEAHFDNVNGGRASGWWCPIGMLRDDFAAASLGPQWSRSWADPGASLKQDGGVLVVSPPPTAAGYAVAVSSAAFDARDGGVLVEVPRSLNAAAAATNFLRLETSGSDSFELQQYQGQLSCRSKVGGSMVTRATVTYDPVQHRWWRLREAGGITFCETSADGLTFATHASVADLFPMDAVDVSFGAGVDQPVSSPGFASFDNVNTPP